MIVWKTRGFQVPEKVVMLTHSASNSNLKSNVKVKVKFTLEQATNVQRGSRGIAVLFP
jgi:hypothetical protein